MSYAATAKFVAMLAIAFAVPACAPISPVGTLGGNQPFAERPSITTRQCVAKGGEVVHDPGDGRVHRKNYLCKNGKPPIGTIRFEDGEPISFEGSVCCPR